MSFTVGIVVMATAIHKKYADQIQACVETWYKDAQKYQFPVIFAAGYHHDDRYPLVNFDHLQEDYHSAADKQFHGLKYLFDNNPCDYYMVVGTDTYINIDNLVKMLAKYDKEQQLYIGGHCDTVNITTNFDLTFHSGGAGFIITHPVLQRLFAMYSPEQIKQLWTKICLRYQKPRFLPFCDVTMAYLCDMMLVPTIREDHFYGCNLKGRVTNDTSYCCNCKDLLADPSQIIACHFMDPPLMREYYHYWQYLKQPLLEVVPQWTVVTSFYHLPRYGQDFNRSVEFYLQKGSFVLSLPVNLVIYCDEEEYDYIYNYRQRLGFLKETQIVIKSFTTYLMYAYIEKIRQNRLGNPIYNNHRNSPTYAALVVSKFEMINLAITENHFQSDFFAWLDFGIAHVVGNFPNQLVRALQQYREKMSMAYTVYLPKRLVTNNAEYYKGDGKCCVAAGFITGHKDYFVNFNQECLDNFIEIVNQGYGHAEQNVIPVIYYRHPDWFEFYFADYQQILHNYDVIRANPKTLINFVLLKAFADNNHLICYQATSKLVEGILHEQVNVGLARLPRLIDNYYVCGFYLQKYDQCLIILQLYQKLLSLYGKSFEGPFHQLLGHIIKNSDYLLSKLTWKNISVMGDTLAEEEITSYINQGYHVFIYDDKFSLTVNSLIIANPVRRPLSHKLNVNYDLNL